MLAITDDTEEEDKEKEDEPKEQKEPKEQREPKEQNVFNMEEMSKILDDLQSEKSDEKSDKSKESDESEEEYDTNKYISLSEILKILKEKGYTDTIIIDLSCSVGYDPRSSRALRRRPKDNYGGK
jgi:hypothetical protein